METKIKDSSKFRIDINGLRAWAVLMVVFYHFNVSGFSGGFVGVDIFFVISGFLMTRIIIEKLDDKNERGQFDFFEFYFSRACRIIPALLVLCAILAVLGWFFLPPAEYAILGSHISASLEFFSNMRYWLEVGYFDSSAHDKWLLHTWSLSVEWQFYFFLPIMLWGLWKIQPGRKKAAILLIFVFFASLVLSIVVTPRDASAAFYFLLTRAWEMLAGGLVYLASPYISLPRWSQKAVEFTGVGLISACIYLLSWQTSWPSWHALVPVLGAVCVLCAARPDSFWTAGRVAQWLGNCSYSVYLWHWPVVVALVYANKVHDAPASFLGLLLSVVFGWLSFTLVEVRLGRRLRALGMPLATRFLVLSVCLLLAFGTWIQWAQGVPTHVGERFIALTQEVDMPLRTNGWCFYSVDTVSSLPVGAGGLACGLGNKQSPIKGLLVGDSFAGHNEPFWNYVAIQENLKINAVTTNWCYPSLDGEFTGPVSSRAYEQCLINRQYFREHVGDYDFVIFAGSWVDVLGQKKMQGLDAAIALAAAKTKMVVLMSSPVQYDANIGSAFKRSTAIGFHFDMGDYGKSQDFHVREANKVVENLTKKYDNAIYLGRDSIFAKNGVVSDMATDDSPFSFDGKHISIAGSKLSAVAFEKSQLHLDFLRRIAEIKKLHPDPSYIERTGR